MSRGIEAFLIYDSPSGYAGSYVVRRLVGPLPSASVLVAATATLEEARAALPKGKRLSKDVPIDDGHPCLVEVWI